MQWLFWVIYQNEKGGQGLTFGVHFLHDFSIKLFLISYSINGQKFQCPNFFPSQDFKQHVLLSSYLDS